jgi:hypothetical protein
MSARTPEAIVEVDVAERRIEVVAPQQVDDAAAEPDAFGIAGRAVEDAGGFGELVRLLLGSGALPLLFLLGVVLGARHAGGVRRQAQKRSCASETQPGKSAGMMMVLLHGSGYSAPRLAGYRTTPAAAS